MKKFHLAVAKDGDANIYLWLAYYRSKTTKFTRLIKFHIMALIIIYYVFRYHFYVTIVLSKPLELQNLLTKNVSFKIFKLIYSVL